MGGVNPTGARGSRLIITTSCFNVTSRSGTTISTTLNGYRYLIGLLNLTATDCIGEIVPPLPSLRLTLPSSPLPGTVARPQLQRRGDGPVPAAGVHAVRRAVWPRCGRAGGGCGQYIFVYMRVLSARRQMGEDTMAMAQGKPTSLLDAFDTVMFTHPDLFKP